MKILEAELKNFGNFVDEKLTFHDGINVIWAKNGAGKSTIHEFILAMLYGLNGEECIRWQSWNGNGCLSGRMRFESGGKTYLLERDFLDGKNKGRLFCETDREELSVENGICIGINEFLQLFRIKRHSKIIDLARQIQTEEKFIRKLLT